jgi:hypothetical protein
MQRRVILTRKLSAAVIGGVLLAIGWWSYGQLTWSGPLPIIKRVGQVCVYPSGEAQLRASLAIERGCLSSSCTERLYAAGNVAVDVSQQLIRFTGFSIFRNLNFPGGSRFCTADCGGASIVEVDPGPLETGTYAIFIDDAEVGTLGIPMRDSSACFARGAWMETLPFLPSPTLTPVPYPWPPLLPTPTWAYPN